MDVLECGFEAGSCNGLEHQALFSKSCSSLGRLELRLSDGLKWLVERLETLVMPQEDQALTELDLEEVAGILHILKNVSVETECAEEIGMARGHWVLTRMSKSMERFDDEVNELVLETISVTLSTLGHLISSTVVGATDSEFRHKPFYVSFPEVEHKIYLNEVKQDNREVQTGDRANVRVGYKLWGGALVLGNFVQTNLPTFKDKTVLEIGAGLGFCGLVAAPIAKQVVLTDFHPRIVENLSYAIALNGLESSCSAERLDWKDLNGQDQVYDIVVGSDIVCEEDDCHLVAKVLEKVLAPDHGVAYIVLGSPESRFGVENFAEVMLENNFLVEEMQDFEIPSICLPSFDPTTGNIFVGTAKNYHFYVLKKPTSQG